MSQVENAVRILITNNTLAERAGTELYVRDIAVALLARGHQPIVYSQVLGKVADELRAATVPVVDDLRRVAEPPHVIHGHHHLETMTAVHHFPGVPAVFFCHGWLPWQEVPPVHPRITRFVAVDELCLQRLMHESGIPPEMTEVLLNFVDLNRFRPRPALPRVCCRALLFSNQAGPDAIADVVSEACARSGVRLDVVGLASGNPTDSPETLLPKYDLVFAKARAALEAMAVGCAVVLCDTAGSGPLVDTENFDALRSQNFGLRGLLSPLSVEALAGQVARFDPDDAAAVSARVRNEASVSDAVDRLLTLYGEVADAVGSSPEAEGRAAADYIRVLAPRIKENDLFHLRLADTVEEMSRWRSDAESALEAVGRLEDEKTEQQSTSDSLIDDLITENRDLGTSLGHQEVRNSTLELEASALRDELSRAYGTLTWRFRERLLETHVGRLVRSLITRFR